MEDARKTKKQLIDELKASRRQIVKIEKFIEDLKRTEERLKEKEHLFNFFSVKIPLAIYHL